VDASGDATAGAGPSDGPIEASGGAGGSAGAAEAGAARSVPTTSDGDRSDHAADRSVTTAGGAGHGSGSGPESDRVTADDAVDAGRTDTSRSGGVVDGRDAETETEPDTGDDSGGLLAWIKSLFGL
jgi:hypothetical protein